MWRSLARTWQTLLHPLRLRHPVPQAPRPRQRTRRTLPLLRLVLPVLPLALPLLLRALPLLLRALPVRPQPLPPTLLTPLHRPLALLRLLLAPPLRLLPAKP